MQSRCAVPKQLYRIDWYKGYIHPLRHQGKTTVRAMDMPHARKFGEMRRPGLIVVVTPAPKEKA